MIHSAAVEHKRIPFSVNQLWLLSDEWRSLRVSGYSTQLISGKKVYLFQYLYNGERKESLQDLIVALMDSLIEKLRPRRSASI
jgi:hypothetical protein